MKLTGYADHISVEQGETIQFHISSELPQFHCEIVRLIHGDTNPKGPNLREEIVPSELSGEHPGIFQPIHTGSYILIEDTQAFRPAEGFSVLLWVKPTLVAAGRQGLFSQWDARTQQGFGLFINADGFLEATVGTTAGTMRLVSERAVRDNDWFLAGLSVDPETGELVLIHDRPVFHPNEPAAHTSRSVSRQPFVFRTGSRLLIAAGWLDGDEASEFASECFNGKISAPRLIHGAASDADLRRLSVTDADPTRILAAWQFHHEPALRVIPDGTGRRLGGRTVNRPMRAVTGHDWRGETGRPTDAPAQYNCIHFHDDDLDDAGWQPSLSLTIPGHFRSGAYAAKITADGAQDYVTFFIRPPSGRPTAPLAVLMPTVSYLAYANESLDFEAVGALMPLRNMKLHPEEYAYLEKNWLRSTYDRHRDGTGICYSSSRRPILTSMRPDHRCRLFDAPHQLGADLHLIDWLESQNIAYDVITDHDLHREGASILKPYRAVMTGTHAEYWTANMLDGLDEYQQQGGRFIYLSGNGLYWVTALDPETNTVCEVRRANGTRSWECAPGETHLSFTGEQGGLWRTRGRPPQRYTGVGMAAQGFDRGVAYRRTEESRDPRAAFIFAGVEDEKIGDFPVLTMNHGAGGYEIDRADPALGTPAHALVLASATGFSDSYQNVVEEALASTPYQGGLINPHVRADMVFYELPNDGAVFSVGSISWCSALSYRNYENNVSQIMRNVVGAFTSQGPLPGQRPTS